MGYFPATTEATPKTDERKLIAPVWHTIVLIVIMVLLSLSQMHQTQKLSAMNLSSRLPLYIFMICFELSLLLYVWGLGLRKTGTRVSDLIGGKWATASDFGRDVGVALLFWVVVVAMLGAMNKILGGNQGALEAVKDLLPQSPAEMVVWVLLSVTAGFCEETVFRGYFQKQFFALTGRVEIAIVLQAIVFGIGHVYQGTKSAFVITIYGALFGILAAKRKSLRPGMMQHAAQDSFSGIAASILARHKYF
jgi:membrane protease YdiL (CAAX protease family)